ncbi:hypothetical protein [Pseudotenacibaculum haliotis]|uniref:Uncharacterized protein n=1 Tax=Pseudotenacibaculum haliotis TaxID=1862138 RepID=A0ABW5LP77_9FLAO
MNVTTNQIKKIHTLLSPEIKKDKEAKESVIIQYTRDQSKVSTKDLTFEQANDLIVDLGGYPEVNEWAAFKVAKDSHRYILSLLQHSGWTYYSHRFNRTVADMNRFGEWLQSEKSPVKKPLVKQTPQETSKTIVALEGVLKHELKKSRR